MKSQEMNKIPRTTLVLYLMAIIMAICAVFNIYASNRYISNALKDGLDISKQLPEVVNYYLGTVTPYVFYGICFMGLGYIINKIVYLTDMKTASRLVEKPLDNKSVKDEDDYDLDKLLKELENS